MNVIREQVRTLLAGPRPLPIVAAGDPVLREPAAALDGQLDDRLLAELVTAMRETMLWAPGVGLAAPQIGLGLAVAVAEDPGLGAAPEALEFAAERERSPWPFRVLINPRYEPLGDELVSFNEGCLSVPGYHAVRARYRSVRANYLDPSGRPQSEELTGWPARIFQHETDHLFGELYLDHADLRTLSVTSPHA